MLLQVELTPDEMDYIATVMLYWRIHAREKMGIETTDNDRQLLEKVFDEACVFEANMVGNNLAQKLLRVNVTAMTASEKMTKYL